jgi:glycosyltransferase involved in cell wall biosynthesis
MKLSIVIPVYNESKTLDEIIRRVEATDVPKEIIVVDDCSTDGSLEKLQQMQQQGRLLLASHPVNRGKGAALKTGFARATGDLVVVQDADLEYDPNDFGKLMEPILRGDADVVIGSRFIGGESHRVLYYWHSVGNAVITTASNMFTNLNLTDVECCYKMFRREVIQAVDIQELRFGFEIEIVAKVAGMGCRIFEVGVSYSGRTYEEGKKINWKDGVRAMYCIVRYNLFS